MKSALGLLILFTALALTINSCATPSEMRCNSAIGEEKETCLNEIREYQKYLDTENPSNPNYLRDRRDREIEIPSSPLRY